MLLLRFPDLSISRIGNTPSPPKKKKIKESVHQVAWHRFLNGWRRKVSVACCLVISLGWMLVPISKSPFHIVLYHLEKNKGCTKQGIWLICSMFLRSTCKFKVFNIFFLNIVWFPFVRKLLSALKNSSHLQHIMSLWHLHLTTQSSKKNQVERPLVDCSISCSVMGCSQMNSTSLGMSLFCLFYIHVPPVLHRGLLRGWDTDNKISKS